MEEQTIWKKGQRWVSENEPELGLGVIKNGGDGRVNIVFPAVDETRCYALESAPLRRVKFSPGDRISLEEGGEREVERVEERGGLLVYLTVEGEVSEMELAAEMSFNKPEERLFAGSMDELEEFDLRTEALWRRAEIQQSQVRGLTGARIDLIPHQLYIADEVSNRLRPRVLLADEVGLGKTIEACLILHRLMLTGRAERVLVLVPEALLHQWFVELLRRFHLSFALFDEERCESINRNDPETNPFLDSQWIVAGLDFLSKNPRRATQVLEADWDVLVVDEAHHLEWSPMAESEAYRLVAGLAQKTESVLLLTATPRQLGPEGHFARLRLLDSARYGNLEDFYKESERYEMLAELVEKIADEKEDREALKNWVAGKPQLEARLHDLEQGMNGARERLIEALLDGFGIGRVMFRNTRRKLGGFPGREACFVPLRGDDEWELKVSWLIGFLEREYPEDKALVILKSREDVKKTLACLTDRTGISGVAFHEELTLLQRDRNAAFFADEDGARVLICSEIGSEGRNFQFARHLILLDLPEDMDLLEQRIGRLDRIGRDGVIRIHVPYHAGTPEEIRLRWIHEGLNAFHKSPAGVLDIQREMESALSDAMENREGDAVEKLIFRTKQVRERMEQQVSRGLDRLLAMRSYRPLHVEKVEKWIRQRDEDGEFEAFVIRMFEHAGMYVEPLAARRWFLRPDALKSGAFPSLPPEGMTVTFDRGRALEREHEGFMTADHPMVRAALDDLLGSVAGNASFGVWRVPGEKRLLLECLVVVECVAPAALNHERYLPQTPLRVMIDHQGRDFTDDADFSPFVLEKGNPVNLLKRDELRRRVLPGMLERVREIASMQSRSISDAALSRMERELENEILRLRQLGMVNDHVDPKELFLLENRREKLRDILSSPRLRLDAVRLIWRAAE